MSANIPERADWQGVGAAFSTLGHELRVRAVAAGNAVAAAGHEAGEGVVEHVTAALTTAVEKLDQATADPVVGRAARIATARLLDAIKVELTGGRVEDDEPPPAQ